MIWGVDVGIRSFAAWGIESDFNVNFSFNGRFEEVNKKGRYEEIHYLRDRFHTIVRPDSLVFIEEPPRAGSLNIRIALQLNQIVGALMAAHEGASYLVPVSSWKKAVIGHGSADKEMVTRWLADNYPRWYARCQGNQNVVDAACISLYGYKVAATSDDLTAAEAE